MDKKKALTILLNGENFGTLEDDYNLPADFFCKENVEYWVNNGYIMDGADYMYIIVNYMFDTWLIDLYFAQFKDIDIDMDIMNENPTGRYTIFDALEEALFFAKEEEKQDKIKLLIKMIDYCASLRK